ncbi:MAG: hypothetical protein VB088_02185 [Sphaerochaeta sp.]|nr:hypothetical protein [Sphaerochaeta sp.]
MENYLVDWRLVLSFLSLVIAAISLSWNIYKSTHIAPQLRLKLYLNNGSVNLQTGTRTKTNRICLEVINMGSVNTLIYHCEVKYPRKIRKIHPRSIIQPYDFQELFPISIASGCETSIYFPPDALDDKKIIKIGVKTQFDKTVWVKKKAIHKYRKDYKRMLLSEKSKQ